ncbi:unnamed protein product [Peronospora farinosa]|uniref:Uncharacterized protein n=1 Tax=Peronospora farinosa TaxID=134698 RepID=A0ABN8BYR2_9STRA|nr:unnamed protein product [Peronospora farinosa]
MDAEVSTAEGSMAFMESLTVLQRLFKKAQNEESIDNEEDNRLTKRDAEALARKKEMKELRARAKAAKEVCGFNPSFSYSESGQELEAAAAKRKREEEESDEQLRKLAHVEAPNTVKEADAGHLCLFAGHLFA